MNTKDPWVAIANRYPEGVRIEGRVTRVVDYGFFIEVEDGVEGLVHVSDMHWTDRNMHPSKMVNMGDLVEVMVLDVIEERRRISLGLKQCKDNPWVLFADTHKQNDKVSGKISSITNFGIFIELDGGLSGLVHSSDIPRDAQGEEAVPGLKKGDEIEVVVLNVDAERERISIGISPLPFEGSK